MPAPIDAARATTNGSTAATNKACNLPTGILAGHRLVLVLRSAGADTHSTPAGWTALKLNVTADASDDTISLWWRLADGAEGTTVTVNGTALLKFAAICWRVTGGGDVIVETVNATGTSTLPNPPSFNTGASNDYLWLWIGGWEGEQTSPPAGNPTNYSNPVGANSGTAGAVTTNCRVAGASRQFTAQTEDPPTWTISVSDDWTAFTVAIAPPVATRGRYSWVELECPFVATRGQYSWVEFETPDAPAVTPTRGQWSWVEFEAPFVATRGRYSWIEIEVPFVATRGQWSWVEFETPFAPTRGRFSWVELEIPTVGGAVRKAIWLWQFLLRGIKGA